MKPLAAILKIENSVSSIDNYNFDFEEEFREWRMKDTPSKRNLLLYLKVAFKGCKKLTRDKADETTLSTSPSRPLSPLMTSNPLSTSSISQQSRIITGIDSIRIRSMMRCS